MKYAIIILFLGGLIAMSSCGPRDNTERSVYSKSPDGSEEIIFFYDSVAFHKRYDETGLLTVTGAVPATFYSLVEAHWLNKPTLVQFTGHEIDREFVPHVVSANCVPDRKIVYGIELITDPDTGAETNRFFVLKGLELRTFEKESEFAEFMTGLGVQDLALIEAKDVIPVLRGRLPRQRW